MIPILGIPYLNRPDLLRRCIQSIDYPVETLVVIDNSNGELNGKLETMLVDFAPPQWVKAIEVITHPNAGVAGSWNEIIKLFPSDYWLICGSDVQFSPGDLEKMHKAYAFHFRATPVTPVGMLFGHANNAFIITAFGVEKVGLFDENFHPAYCEDCDWFYRATLAGVHMQNVEGCNIIHGEPHMKGSCTVNSDPKLRAANIRTHHGNFIYYERKWGGRNGEETFKSPFNSGVPVTFWSFDPRIRKAQQW